LTCDPIPKSGSGRAGAVDEAVDATVGVLGSVNPRMTDAVEFNTNSSFEVGLIVENDFGSLEMAGGTHTPLAAAFVVGVVVKPKVAGGANVRGVPEARGAMGVLAMMVDVSEWA